MNTLKYLSEDLKFGRNFEPPLREYLLESYGDFTSGKIVGCQKLNIGNLHILCFDKAFYLLDQDRQIFQQNVGPHLRYVAYIYVPYFRGINDECFPVHTFFRDDGRVLFYKLDTLTLNFFPVSTSSMMDNFSALNLQSITAFPRGEAYVYQVGNTMYKWSYFDPIHPLCVFSPMERGTVQYATFLQDANIFFCVYQNVLNGETVVEFSERCATMEIFTPVERFSLGRLNYDSTVIKKISDQLVICLTPSKTWSFGSDVKVSQRKNKGLPSAAQFFSVVSDHTVKSLRLHTSCDVFEALYPSILESKTPMRWSLKKVHSISKYNGSLVDFSYELQENLHIIIYARGSVVLVNTLTLQTLVSDCKYENKSYFAAEVIANQGTDLTGLLLCGASGDHYGFFERRFLQYPNCKRIDPFLRDLSHIPVTNIWSTRKGIYYESLGMIYNNESDNDVGQEGMWVLRSGEVLHATDDKVLFMIPVTDLSRKNRETYPSGKEIEFIATIDINGTLKLLEYTEKSTSNEVLQLQLEDIFNEATVISASYDSRREILHIVSFISYRRIVYCNNKNQSYSVGIEPDFQITGLEIIDDYGDETFSNISSLLVAATDLCGRIRIYSISTEKIVSEFNSSQNNRFQMLSFFGFIIFYNEFETIMLRTNDLIYGNLVLPEIIPYKIVHLEHNKICILNNKWRLEFLEIPGASERQSVRPSFHSQYYEFDDYVPLKMSLIPGHNNLVAMAIENFSNPQKVKLIVFDYVSFKILKVKICAQNEIVSNVLLISCSDRLIFSYSEHGNSTVMIFDLQLNLIRKTIIDYTITSIHFKNPYFVFNGSEQLTYKAADGSPDKLPLHFNRPRHSKSRPVYEAHKKPLSITWYHGKKDEFRATDVDILTDFLGRSGPSTLAEQTNYKLYQALDNHISIDNFERMIPSKILNITPINELMYNIQDGTKRLQYTRPLFLITCTHNSVYILCAKYKEALDGETKG